VRKWLAWLLGVIVVLGVTLFVLHRAYLLNHVDAGTNNAPTLPACKGEALSEGFTYHFRDPRRGEMVVFHASGGLGAPTITPDPDSRELAVVRRVVGVPGDQVEAHGGRVYVNGVKADDIATKNFKRVDLGHDQYFVLGDNRSFSVDSRSFGPVPRDAIFGHVFLIYRPVSDFGGLPSRKAGSSPGEISC
jgi:signal peptidase I